MRNTGRERALTVALATMIVVSACGDDDGKGGTDGGTGGAPGSGGSATGGGKATGGTATGGAKASGGMPGSGGAATGGSDTGGTASGGTATGGANTDGGNTGGTAPDAGPDGGATPEGGSTEAGADASDAGNGDWLSSHAPPCPPNPSFPIGTYKLNVVAADETADNVTGAGPYDCFAAVTRGTGTLAITLDPQSDPDYPLYNATVNIPLVGAPNSVALIDVFTSDPKSIRVVGHCGSVGDCPPDEITFEAVIDRRTSVVTAFEYSYSHLLFANHGFHVDGTGWPSCPATDASPPDWVPPPTDVPVGYVNCYQPDLTPIGCTRHYQFTDIPGPYPRCATSTDTCNTPKTCTDVSDGYVVECCPNP